jgi:stage II sporulation protein D
MNLRALLLTLSLFPFILASPNLRVALLFNQNQIEISATAGFAIYHPNTLKVLISSPGRKVWKIKPVRGGFLIGRKKLEGKKIYIKPHQFSVLKLNQKRYRGEFEIRQQPLGKLLVINKIDVEQYLYGVIKMEVPVANWPVEAIKAQIVAARTFALSRRSSQGEKIYDVDATVQSQVYGGLDREDPYINNLVDATRGEVISYQGKFIYAAYHSCSGGYTEDDLYVWNEDQPYLVSLPDFFCKSSPHYTWQTKISLQELQTRLKKKGYKIGSIKLVKNALRSPSGRVINLVIKHTRGTLVIKGATFRKIMGLSRIKSTNFTLRQQGNQIFITGKGWGHGVGMPQWGARGLAEAGYSYKDILRYFYPGVKIEKKW